MCVDCVDRKQEISHLTTLFLFAYPLYRYAARSYVYQTGRFITETPSIGSSLFRIDDKRHPNYTSRQSVNKEKWWFASYFKLPDGILPGVR
jgi:hypothetical protein